jgi:hypothetical protein
MISADPKHHEIAVRYGWAARQRARRRGKISLASLRVAELDRIFTFWFGKYLPESHQGFNLARVMVEHILLAHSDPAAKIAGWLRYRAPWMKGISATQ